MRDPAIGLAACLLILVFLVAIGSATAITHKHIEQGVRQNFAAAGLRWPVTRRHVFTPCPSALYTQVG